MSRAADLEGGHRADESVPSTFSMLAPFLSMTDLLSPSYVLHTPPVSALILESFHTQGIKFISMEASSVAERKDRIGEAK